MKRLLDEFFAKLIRAASGIPLKGPPDLIFKSNGIMSVAEMVTVAGVGERQLERLFKKYIGLAPKYYARIIRFNYIFQLIKSKKNSWSEIVYQSGYYDQSHFIHNFKAFTGEDPSAYFLKIKTWRISFCINNSPGRIYTIQERKTHFFAEKDKNEH